MTIARKMRVTISFNATIYHEEDGYDPEARWRGTQIKMKDLTLDEVKKEFRYCVLAAEYEQFGKDDGALNGFGEGSNFEMTVVPIED